MVISDDWWSYGAVLFYRHCGTALIESSWLIISTRNILLSVCWVLTYCEHFTFVRDKLAKGVGVIVYVGVVQSTQLSDIDVCSCRAEFVIRLLVNGNKSSTLIP